VFFFAFCADFLSELCGKTLLIAQAKSV